MSDVDHSWHPAKLLDDGRKLAAVASIIFLVSLFLPWYEKSVFVSQVREFRSQNLSAFGAFTWIEAALLLVDAAVLALLYLRSTNRRVELPGTDGTMVAIAGGWMVLLLVVRVFDKPSVSGEGAGASVGLQWGLLIAMASAGAILAAGLATRAIERATKHGTGGPGNGGAPRDDAPPPPPASEAPTQFGSYGSSLGGQHPRD